MEAGRGGGWWCRQHLPGWLELVSLRFGWSFVLCVGLVVLSFVVCRQVNGISLGF